MKYLGKIARVIGILCKARKYLKESLLLTLYYAFIYPYFAYCNTVAGNTYSSFLEPLTKLQKRAIRIICGARKYDHTYPLFQQLSILSIKNFYVYSVQIFLYKYYKQSIPAILSGFFHPRDQEPPPHHGVRLQKLPSPKWRNWGHRFKVKKPLFWGMRFYITDMEQHGSAM